MINTNQQYNLSVYLIDTLNNEIPINSENVVSLTISESILEILPRLDMMINNAGSFMETFPLTDKMRVRVVLESMHRTVGNLKDDPNYVDATFVISNYFAMADPIENKYFTFKISGYLSYPYTSIRFSSFKGSSDDVIESVANIAGWKSDIRAKGGESIRWIQNNNSLNFLYHINERAYIAGDGVFIYSNLKNTLIYTSLYTEIGKSSSKRAVYNQNIEYAYLDKTVMNYNGYNLSNNTCLYNNKMLYGYDYMYFNGVDRLTQTVRANEKMTTYYNRTKLIPKEAITNFDDYGLILDDDFENTIFKGKIQNDYFRHLLFSNTVELNINSSSETELFDKITLDLRSTTAPNTVSEPFSGDYLVGAITHSLTQNIPYSKKVILCRFGINDYDSVYVKDIV
jgi:hypothetical protein